jgi:hypothetical protein
MKALSIRQPWAWLICAGYKDVENRSWYLHMPPLLNHPSYEKNVPMHIYVHAGKISDVEKTGNGCSTERYILAMLKEEQKEEYFKATFTLGAIIGEVDIVGCSFRFGEELDNLYSPWHEPGQYAFMMANPQLYDKPIPYRGHLGFFEVNLPEVNSCPILKKPAAGDRR